MTLQAMIEELANFAPAKLNEDDPLLDSNWNALIDLANRHSALFAKIETLVPPVGYVHIRFPGTPTPDVLWDTKGAQWKDISPLFPGVFFRTAGGGAASFKADVPLTGSTPPSQLTYTQGDGGSGGGQEDGAPNITGGIYRSVQYALGAQDGYGAFDASAGWQGSAKSGSGSGFAARDIAFSAARCSAKYTSVTEVRPRNITVQIWLRLL